ncbi:MAG: GNAT family N-acetyltransferase [Candidatus Protochlamydia sp.]|nr:GNAT family N-acetyltransferase [Candidatus Protochlamydia sp.]
MEISLAQIPFLYDDANQTLYGDLILPSAKEELMKVNKNDGFFVCIEARVAGEIVGLALARFYFENRGAHLYSLFVKETQRCQGIGLALFKYLEETLVKNEKATVIAFDFLDELLYAPAIEKILAHQQWSTPSVYLMRCYFDKTFNPDWWTRPARLPEGMEFFLWKDLTLQDRNAVEAMKNNNEFLSPLWPFHEEERIDFFTSVGLRQHHQIVGWNITHRVDPVTLRFSILFIRKEFQFTGLSIQLLVESLRLMRVVLDEGDPAILAYLELRLKHITPSWLRFVNRRLVPHTSKIEYKKWAIKFYLENILKT